MENYVEKENQLDVNSNSEILSDGKIMQCNDLKQEEYSLGIQYFNNIKFSKATRIFTTLGKFKNSEQILTYIQYEKLFNCGLFYFSNLPVKIYESSAQCYIESTVTSYDIEMVIDNQYSLPVPIKENYEFLGWYLNDELLSQFGQWTYTTNGIIVTKWK